MLRNEYGETGRDGAEVMLGGGINIKLTDEGVLSGKTGVTRPGAKEIGKPSVCVLVDLKPSCAWKVKLVVFMRSARSRKMR